MSKTHLGLPAEQAGDGTGSAGDGTGGRQAPRNGYLEGPFASVAQEVTAHGLQVTGKIPAELNGRFLRVGGNPNPADPEDPRTYNWFIGSGMVFGVRLREGRAEWYRNRFVRDDRVSRAMHLPRVPGPDQLSRREPYQERKGPRYVEANVTNTHVFAVNGRTYAFAEAGVLPMELSYELETVARSDFGGTLNGAWTGHPHRDPVTGELHGIAYFWQWDHASYQVLGTDGTITKRIDVPLTGPSTIHDMAFTEKYAVFLDGPVIFNEGAHAAGYEFPYMWDQGYPVRWAVIDKNGTAADVRFCASDQSAVFHILNAFDLPGGRIAVDGVSYPKLFVDDLSGPTDSKGRLDRFILDPAAGTTKVERLDDRPQEMPRMDERISGRPHRYGYFSSRLGNSGILKQDLLKGAQEFYDHGPGRVGIETLFVPMSATSAEDDGWLITSVIDMPTDSSEVLIFHAQDLLGGPVAKVHIPHRHNTGFHGNWIADAELEHANGQP